jgi:hypothetical protein
MEEFGDAIFGVGCVSNLLSGLLGFRGATFAEDLIDSNVLERGDVAMSLRPRSRRGIEEYESSEPTADCTAGARRLKFSAERRYMP